MSPSAHRTAPRYHHFHQAPRPSPSTSPLRALPLSLSLPLSSSLSFSLSLLPASRLPFIPSSRSRALSLAHSCLAHTHTYTFNMCTHHPHTRTHAHTLTLAYYPPTGSLFLRVTTQWRCHTLAPSSNQCYCFIVPLLLLLLDTRKGDPSIPRRSETLRRVARLRFASPRFVVSCRASRRSKASNNEQRVGRAEPSRSEQSQEEAVHRCASRAREKKQASE